MKEIKNPKIIDGTLAFQEARILALYEKMYRQETHSTDDLLEAINAVNGIDFHSLSSNMKEKFQSLCGRLHEMKANEIVDKIFDATQELRRNGIKNFRDIETLQRAIAEFSHKYRGLSEMNALLLEKASVALNLLCLEKKEKCRPHPPLFSSNKKLNENRSCRKEEVELAVELLELAGCLYKQKKQKEITQDILKKIAFFSGKINLPSITQKSCRKEIFTFIQAAVIKSFQIGRSDGYIPSKREILEILEEGECLS